MINYIPFQPNLILGLIFSFNNLNIQPIKNFQFIIYLNSLLTLKEIVILIYLPSFHHSLNCDKHICWKYISQKKEGWASGLPGTNTIQASSYTSKWFLQLYL